MSPFLFVSFCNWVQMKQNETYFFTFEIKPIDSEKLNAFEIKYVKNLSIWWLSNRLGLVCHFNFFFTLSWRPLFVCSFCCLVPLLILQKKRDFRNKYVGKRTWFLFSQWEHKLLSERWKPFSDIKTGLVSVECSAIRCVLLHVELTGRSFNITD